MPDNSIPAKLDEIIAELKDQRELLESLADIPRAEGPGTPPPPPVPD